MNVLSVVFNRYESATNVFGVGLTMNASIMNVGVEVKLNIASVLINTPLAVEARIAWIVCK